MYLVWSIMEDSSADGGAERPRQPLMKGLDWCCSLMCLWQQPRASPHAAPPTTHHCSHTHIHIQPQYTGVHRSQTLVSASDLCTLRALTRMKLINKASSWCSSLICWVSSLGSLTCILVLTDWGGQINCELHLLIQIIGLLLTVV